MNVNSELERKRNKPRVSIGLPVFNGEKYLEDALNSILAQTYQDFEIIVSDNASDDNTPRICYKYADEDSRIRYYRNERNIGAAKNFNRVFERSTSEYFKWAACDDVLAPEYLSRCISVLDQEPSVIMCHSKTGYVDEHGRMIGTCDFEMNVDSPKPYERFGNLISFSHPIWTIFGVIRASSLRMTPLMENYTGSDRNLLAEIGLIGRIYEIPECLFFRRIHPQAYTQQIETFPSRQEQMAWWDPTKAGKIIFTYNIIEYFRSVKRVPLSWIERFYCYAQIASWLMMGGWGYLCLDLEMAPLIRSSLGRKLASNAKILWHKVEKRLGVMI